jgi:hypothetical protein
MPPRMTSMHAEAPDAFEHTLDSAGALTFVNDSSGAAAPPAPYHAVAQRQLACSFLSLAYPSGGETGHVYRRMHVRRSSAATGRMPNTMSACQRLALRHASAVALDTRQKPSMRG